MARRRAFFAATALALLCGARAALAHLEPHVPGPIPPGEPIYHVHCEDGAAASHACQHVDLLAHLPLSSFGFGAESANDVWGWTDPETGREYALLGLNVGTAFVDVSEPDAPLYLGLLPTHTACRSGAASRCTPTTPSS